MNVYMVPASTGRYELYCETRHAPAFDVEGGLRPGPLSRLSRWFRQVLAEAERERREAHDHAGEGRGHRAWRWAVHHAAEAIAEQRLLWHLRGQTVATIVHPDDLDATGARAIVARVLGRDSDRHLRWLLVDGILAAVTGPLFFFVPGPNVVAYYFLFRTAGHFFAWRGARRGLDAVRWHYEASAPLGEVRPALALPAAERRVRMRDIERRLGLAHLVSFVERVAVTGS
jgi:hypothetical protein